MRAVVDLMNSEKRCLKTISSKLSMIIPSLQIVFPVSRFKVGFVTFCGRKTSMTTVVFILTLMGKLVKH